MELQVKLTRKIDDIQKKLRECNYECNQLKEFVEDSLPELLMPPAAIPQDKKQDHPLLKTADTPVVPPEIRTVVPPVAETPAKPVEPKTPATPETPPQIPVNREPVRGIAGLSTPKPVKPKAETQAKAETPQSPAQEPKRKTPVSERITEAPSRNLEEFIGGNLLNKIGIGILIIGIGIFVKYAIDQNWINATGRVLIGLLSGGILLGLAHRLRKQYKAFSSVLLGGGISVLYFSVAIAFHTFGLLGQTPAFALMVLITGAAVFFSIAYDRREIGILALLGGFATPFLVNNGSGNYMSLFTYILVLNVGFMVLSWFRDWKAIRILSYAFTIVLVGGWLGMNLYNSELSVLGGTLTFATIFFVVFFAMNLAFNVKAGKPLGALEYILILSNTMFYYISAMVILHYVDAGRYMGLFTALMGVFHLAFIYPVRRLLKTEMNLSLLLIGVVLTFLTLAIPIQLEGSFITLFWAAEAVILLALARRSGLKMLVQASQVVSILAILALGWHWRFEYFDAWGSGRTPFFNGAFLTSLLVGGSMIGLYFIYRKGKESIPGGTDMSKLYQFLALPVLYLAGLLELIDQSIYLGNDGWVAITMISYSTVFLCAMQYWAIRDRRQEFGNFIAVLSFIAFVCFVSAHFMPLRVMRNDYVLGVSGGSGYPGHLLMLPGLFGLLALNLRHASLHTNLRGDIGKIVVWAAAIVFLVLSSLELENLMLMAGFNLKTAHKVGYPILWGLSAFTMILMGMRWKFVSLRIGGLALFCLILVKLFGYDIREVPTGGKIAAFISLGVLLLIISFMYQRLKKLLFE